MRIKFGQKESKNEQVAGQSILQCHFAAFGDSMPWDINRQPASFCRFLLSYPTESAVYNHIGKPKPHLQNQNRAQGKQERSGRLVYTNVPALPFLGLGTIHRPRQ